MAKLFKFKLFLILISILLGLWNYFWRSKINLPYLSELNPIIVYIIAGGIFLLTLMIKSKSKK